MGCRLGLPICAWRSSRFPATATTRWLDCVHRASDSDVSLVFEDDGKMLQTRAADDLAPQDLLVLSHCAADTDPGRLEQYFLQLNRCPMLVCPQDPAPIARVLLLFKSESRNHHDLRSSARLSREIGAVLVVLTGANSARVAKRNQQPARLILAQESTNCEFDFIVGTDIEMAAASVARWRHCQLVVTGRYGNPPWRRWLRGSTSQRLLGLAESVAVLSFPGPSCVVPQSVRKYAAPVPEEVLGKS